MGFRQASAVCMGMRVCARRVCLIVTSYDLVTIACLFHTNSLSAGLLTLLFDAPLPPFHRPSGNYEIIVATTKLVNGNTLMQTLLHDVENKLVR